MKGDYFHTVIVSSDEILYEADVTKLLVPGIYQELAILPHHTPLYAKLVKGKVILYPLHQAEMSFPITDGIIRVKNNQASVLVGF